MKTSVLFFIFIFFIVNSFGQSYGLEFSGHNVPLNERTELYLTPNKPLPVQKELNLSFNFRFQPNLVSYYGYVYRLLIGDQNIDFIHAILPGTEDNFQLVFSDRPSKISFHIPLEKLISEWTGLQFNINFNDGTFKCIFEDTVLVDEIDGYNPANGVSLFFGAHEHGHFTTTDVAEMRISDIQLRTDHKTYIWPLNQESGEIVQEINHKKNGLVKHPIWLSSLHSRWKKIASMELNGLAHTAFNEKEDLVYIITSNSLLTLNLRDSSIFNEEYNETFTVNPTSNVVFDPYKNRLVSYSVDHNKKSYYNADTKIWPEVIWDTTKLTTFWHHNSLMHPDGSLYIFGGYGYHLYKNEVLRSGPESSGFDSLSYTGDYFPRYLAAAAFDERKNKIYLVGGYGSRQGQQTMNPDYYFDILEYSFEESKFKSLHEYSNIDQDFCFANSAVIDDDNQLYALSFSKYEFDNSLQLIKINLDNFEIEELGSKIDFKFIDVKSNAELYYNRESEQLITTVSYFNEGKTELDVYTISFPPGLLSESAVSNSIKKNENSPAWYFYLLILIIISIALFVWHYIRLNNRKKQSESSGESKVGETVKREPKPMEPEKSFIRLFGGFQVIDKDGNDITGSFTPLLKKLFLFILLSSLKHKKGVSSQILSETFWFDKSIESARNNRAVNIVKLKSLLDKVGKVNISKDTGYWKFEYDPATINIDYANYLDILKKDKDLNKADIEYLLRIIDRGQLLLNINAEWLDSYKSEVSNEVIDTLVAYIANSNPDPDFILHLANCMFTFDIASEEAMILQCQTLFKLGKHSLAKKSYAKFVKEYTTLYDEEYSRSFSDIIDSGKSK